MKVDSQKNKIIESITKISLGKFYDSYEHTTITKYYVRIWRDELEVKIKYNNNDLKNLAQELYVRFQDQPEVIAAELSKVARVNAVEIVDHYGDGLLICPDWQ